ncbi:MAG: hypothetical protein JXA54_15190 [Candidatus Heimdallarchaeota archaeon]|nr:hypothetical protein [Candidatus Heimdallarchaeota archaeon]
MKKITQNKRLIIGLIFILCFNNLLHVIDNKGDTLERSFVVNSGSKVLLDEESVVYYNGTISITITSGVGVNATINSETKEIEFGQTKVFTISNTKSIYFLVSSEGYSEGFFIIDLNVDLTVNEKNPIRITIGVLATVILIVSVITYLIRAKKLEPKEGEKREELTDPEAVRRREEATGAEKKFWGLDKD